jgi:hypothetical protein
MTSSFTFRQPAGPNQRFAHGCFDGSVGRQIPVGAEWLHGDTVGVSILNYYHPLKSPVPIGSPGADEAMVNIRHKEALAVGRAEGRAVRAYLEALDSHRPKRGRKRTPESIANRLLRIDEELPGQDPLGRLHLAQEKIALQAELAAMSENGIDISSLEAEFIKVAAEYAKRKGISYAAFRLSGVSAAVLKQAGISRAA